MALFVPVSHDLPPDLTGDPFGLGSSSEKVCEQCSKSSRKTRPLPGCKHELCVKCLNKSLNRLSTWVDEDSDVLECPKCGAESSKLDISLMTKSDKPQRQTAVNTNRNALPSDRKETATDSTDLLSVDVRETKVGQRQRNLTKFYTTRTSSDDKSSESVLTRSSAMPRLGGHRSAVRYSMRENYNGYPTKVSKDEHQCLYFDGDMLSDNCTLLCDWRNRVLKVYEKSGQFVCSSEKLEEGPLHVSVMSNNVIVVTFGAKSQQIVFMSFVDQQLNIFGTTNIRNGYVYATTKFEDKCVGILEIEDKAPCLAFIEVQRSKIVKDTFRNCVKNWTIAAECPVSTESGLYYCHAIKYLYVTYRRALYCYSADMKLVFKRTYDNAGKDLYMLGSISGDGKNCIYVTSDQCVLRVNSKTGALQSTIPTDMDPYHIIMGHDKTFLVMMGNQNNTLYCMLEQTGLDS